MHAVLLKSTPKHLSWTKGEAECWMLFVMDLIHLTQVIISRPGSQSQAASQAACVASLYKHWEERADLGAGWIGLWILSLLLPGSLTPKVYTNRAEVTSSVIGHFIKVPNKWQVLKTLKIKVLTGNDFPDACIIRLFSISACCICIVQTNNWE